MIMRDEVLQILCDCIVDGELDYAKFVSKHPITDSIKQELVKLCHEGYIAIDFGDDRILNIAAKKRLIKNANA